MNLFHYRISLRIFHPVLSAAEIDKLLNIQATNSRKNTRSKPTYWCAKLVDTLSSEMAFEESISDVAQLLKERKNVFEIFQKQEVKCIIVVATFSKKNHGFIIEPFASYVFSKLNIEIGFDIYPGNVP